MNISARGVTSLARRVNLTLDEFYGVFYNVLYLNRYSGIKI